MPRDRERTASRSARQSSSRVSCCSKKLPWLNCSMPRRRSAGGGSPQRSVWSGRSGTEDRPRGARAMLASPRAGRSLVLLIIAGAAPDPRPDRAAGPSVNDDRQSEHPGGQGAGRACLAAEGITDRGEGGTPGAVGCIDALGPLGHQHIYPSADYRGIVHRHGPVVACPQLEQETLAHGEINGGTAVSQGDDAGGAGRGGRGGGGAGRAYVQDEGKRADAAALDPDRHDVAAGGTAAQVEGQDVIPRPVAHLDLPVGWRDRDLDRVRLEAAGWGGCPQGVREMDEDADLAGVGGYCGLLARPDHGVLWARADHLDRHWAGRRRQGAAAGRGGNGRGRGGRGWRGGRGRCGWRRGRGGRRCGPGDGRGCGGGGPGTGGQDERREGDPGEGPQRMIWQHGVLRGREPDAGKRAPTALPSPTLQRVPLAAGSRQLACQGV